MLEKLLKEISSGGTMDISTLAARLDTTPAMITTMLDFLARSGTIEKYSSCDRSCTACSLGDVCHSDETQSTVWEYRTSG